MGAVINYWGGGQYYFKSEGPKILVPQRLTAQKSCPLQKCVPKIVPLPCDNILSIQMLYRENPYEGNFETIIFSLE